LRLPGSSRSPKPHDGGQPLPVEASRAQGRARCEAHPAASRQDRHAARRDPVGQQPPQRGRRDAHHCHHRPALREGELALAVGTSRSRSRILVFSRSRPSRRRGAPPPHRPVVSYALAPAQGRDPIVWFVTCSSRGCSADAHQAGKRSRFGRDPGGAALARAGRPVLPGQAPRDARDLLRPRVGERRRRDDPAQPDSCARPLGQAVAGRAAARDVLPHPPSAYEESSTTSSGSSI